MVNLKGRRGQIRYTGWKGNVSSSMDQVGRLSAVTLRTSVSNPKENDSCCVLGEPKSWVSDTGISYDVQDH